MVTKQQTLNTRGLTDWLSQARTDIDSDFTKNTVCHRANIDSDWLSQARTDIDSDFTKNEKMFQKMFCPLLCIVQKTQIRSTIKVQQLGESPNHLNTYFSPHISAHIFQPTYFSPHISAHIFQPTYLILRGLTLTVQFF